MPYLSTYFISQMSLTASFQPLSLSDFLRFSHKCFGVWLIALHAYSYIHAPSPLSTTVHLHVTVFVSPAPDNYFLSLFPPKRHHNSLFERYIMMHFFVLYSFLLRTGTRIEEINALLAKDDKILPVIMLAHFLSCCT